MKRCLVLFIAWLAVLSGCAYYNTFYNARKAWEKAMDERDRNPSEAAGATEI